jgi:hemolysin activation/secretion protein
MSALFRLTLTLGLFAALSAHAQVIPPAVDPGALQQRQIEEDRRQRQLDELRRGRIEKPVDADAIKSPTKPITGEEVRFLVKAVEFSVSELLTRDELDALAAPYQGRTVSLAEIQALVAQVNELYRKKGIVTAQAILPPQDLTAGIVRIRLIEGRVGKISVQGNESTNEDYLTARVRRQPGDLVVLSDLEQDLVRFNRTNDAQVRAELKPGEQVGQTDVQLLLTEPPRHSLKLFSDNHGSTQTGELRGGLMYRNASLLGRRDDLTLTTSHARGQESYSVAYGMPITTLGTRLNIAYYHDETEVKKGPFAALDLHGRAEALVASLRHPLVIGDTYQLDGVLGGKDRNTRNWFDDVLLQDTDTWDYSAGLEGQLADNSGYWLASITTSRVHSDQLGSASRQFNIWRGSLRRSHNLAPGYALVGSINWQYSGDDLLPASEQFLIGGEYSVRGYGSGLLSGDKGYNVNLEFHHPVVLLEGPDAPKASGFFFIDYGEVRPHRPAGDPRDHRDWIASAGWGMSVAIGKNVSLRGTFGVPLEDVPEEPRGHRTTFQLVWSLL